MIAQLAKEAGLVQCGINADGDTQYIGSDKEWNAYSELEKNFEKLAQDEEVQMALMDAQDQIQEQGERYD